MTVITHARRKSRLASMIDAAGGISVLRALAAANVNLEVLKPPSLEEVSRQVALLAEIAQTATPPQDDEALDRLYGAATSIIDAAGPFDMTDICAVAAALCDLVDFTSPESPFDWRVPQVYSSSMSLMLTLPDGDPRRAAIKTHLDELIKSKMA